MGKELKRYLIAVPTMDMVPVPFVASLLYMHRVGASRCTFMANSLVYTARNQLVKEAIETGADRVLWLDSDMQFDVDLMQRLADDMDNGLDFVAGLYFKRRIPTVPVVYKSVDVCQIDGRKTGKTQVYEDYPKYKLFQIGGSGFGAVMCTTKMLTDVAEKYGAPFDPILGALGEDLSFCWRARQLGYKLYCDSRIKVYHVGQMAFGEEHYKGEEQNGTTEL